MAIQNTNNILLVFLTDLKHTALKPQAGHKLHLYRTILREYLRHVSPLTAWAMEHAVFTSEWDILTRILCIPLNHVW